MYGTPAPAATGRATGGDPGRPLVSVVIPAHDEARVLGRCLDRLAPLVADGRAEVVVVANGCTDDTAALARRSDGVVVVELAAAGKAGALNAGDAAATAFPRVYLDADVELEPAAVLALAAALPADRAVVAAPRVAFDTAGRPYVVRAFFTVFARLPYASDGLVGLGVYALSQAGRARFETFPALTADDLYVQRHFAPAERRVLADHTFTVHTPYTVRGLLAVRTRAARGAGELTAATGAESTAAGSGAALVTLVRAEPRLLPAAVVYAGVTAAARVRAAARRRRGSTGWERDDTTR